MTISVLIADDHPIFRRGLREIIEKTHRYQVIAEAGDGIETIAMVREHRPAVVVLDIAMPKLDGLEVLEQLGNLLDKPTVVLLTMYDDYVEAAVHLGAAGYILKENAEDEIIACLDEVIRGRIFVSKGVYRSPGNNAAIGPLASLTSSELRILKLTAELKTSRDIGEALCISHRTVQNHRVNICNKLGLKGDKALLKFALQHKDEAAAVRYRSKVMVHISTDCPMKPDQK